MITIRLKSREPDEDPENRLCKLVRLHPSSLDRKPSSHDFTAYAPYLP